ncbi:MAG: ethanolamine utilization protein EutL, partial [Clostridium sp.]
MKYDAIRATVLGVKIISNVSPDLVEAFNLEPHQKS